MTEIITHPVVVGQYINKNEELKEFSMTMHFDMSNVTLVSSSINRLIFKHDRNNYSSSGSRSVHQ